MESKVASIDRDVFFGKVDKDVTFGKDVEMYFPINLYGCTIGDHVRIGCFVEIQRNVTIGNYVKIGTHTFICSGTEIQDDVLIGHGVMFCNDLFPRSSINGKLKTKDDWICGKQVVEYGASIGTGAIILPNVRIGMFAMVGAGAIVSEDVPERTIVRCERATIRGNIQ